MGYTGKKIETKLYDTYTKAEVDAEIAAIDLTAFNSQVQLKNYTTTQRNALTGLESGDTIFNSTTGSIEFYDGTNWIATNLVPTVNSVSGTIYSGAASTLTLSLSNATDTIDVKYFEGGTLLATDSGVTVTSGSASSTVPSAVYGQTAGDTISIQIFNQDGTPSSNSVNKTVAGLPTGGTITSSGGYRYHTFSSSGTFTVSSGFSATADALVVAGGGGGGSPNQGGGGGAGGYIATTKTLSSYTGSNTITIGAGGSLGANGANSTALGSTATGGGRGGIHSVGGVEDGGTGGSGGGAAMNYNGATFVGGAGTSGQGYAGGNAPWNTDSPRNCGGGGGANQAGFTGSGSTVGTNRPDGGAGKTWLNGTTYAGGGGGGDATSDRAGAGYGYGGAGGGGNGARYSPSTVAQAGTANTGGGGGGRSNAGPEAAAGGSGIVIIRYQL